MSSSEDEYEVESILCAKVEKKKGRKRALVWKYKVRWKGYKSEDDTWEPEESFSASADILDRFWQRARTDGRDHNDIHLFEPGEEFLPVGPPLRKRKVAPTKEKSGESSSPRKNGTSPPPQKRRRTDAPTSQNEQPQSSANKGKGPSKPPSTKLAKTPSIASPVRSPRKPTRKPSVDEEIIPDSDEEADQPNFTHSNVNVHSPNTGLSNDNPIVLDTDEADIGPPSADLPASPNDRTHTPSIPLHQLRATNPLVKLVKDPNATEVENAIAIKVPLGGMGRSPLKGGSGTKSNGMAGKNKSSILTYEKGELKTVKGRYRKPEEQKQRATADDADFGSLFGDGLQEDEIEAVLLPEAPPTAEELLKMAGVNPDAEIDELEEFEDDTSLPAATNEEQMVTSGEAEEEEQVITTIIDDTTPPPQPSKSGLPLEQNLEMFPARNGSATAGPSGWKRPSSIFQTLGFGFNSRFTSTQTQSTPSEAPTLTLRLDPSLVLPVILSQVYPANALASHSFSSEKGPSGKFYSSELSGSLLDSLRTGEFAAQVTLSVEATEAQQACFSEFKNRLKSGCISLFMLGQDLLAFCSSDDVLLVNRLNIHPSLVPPDGGIVMSQVIIENYSAYVDAALKASDWGS